MHKVISLESCSAAEAAAEAERTINELASQRWEFEFATTAYLQRREPLDSSNWNADNVVSHTLFFRQATS